MNIIVTGASRGIGYQVARRLSRNQNIKIIVVARSFDKLKELQENCEFENGYQNIYPIAFDLEDDQGINILIEKITQIFQGVDICINCAGVLINKPFSLIKIADAKRLFDLNFFSVAQLVRKLLTNFNKNAHVVNITSMGGVQGSSKYKGLSYYSASKAALNVLTECLAEELKEEKISFNALALGAVQTEMLAEAFPGYKAPLEANEIAKFIAEFALTGHHYFNGKILPVALSTP